MAQQNRRGDWGLFFEGIRQCRMMGILGLLGINLSSILLPLYHWLQGGDGLDAGQANIWVCSAFEANGLLVLVIPLAGLMTLMLFRFLNNRAASDLYHAIPHKRLALYISYGGAILTWAALMVVSSILVMLPMSALVPRMNLLYDTILPYGMSVFSAAALLVAGVMVGMSLSGTLFTNVLLSGIVLFAPPFFVWFFRSILTDPLPFMVDTMSRSDSGKNLLFAMVRQPLSAGTVGSDPFCAGWSRWLFTLLLAVLYFVIGALIFCHRKSETAGQAAPSRLFQHIYRILVTMLYCAVVTSFLAMEIENNGASDAIHWLRYLILYFIGLLIYFAYELITTHKWRNLLTALPGLGVVAALNGIVLFGLHVSYQDLLSLRPAASEIKSVSIIGSDYSAFSYDTDYYEYSTYVGLACAQIEIQDPTVISLVSYTLHENLETWVENPDTYYSKYMDNSIAYFESDGSFFNSPYVRMGQQYVGIRVVIRTDDAQLERIIYMSAENMDQMMTRLSENRAYTDAWRTMPDVIDNTLRLYGIGLSEAYAQADMLELYHSLRAELQTIPFETLYQCYSQGVAWDASLSYVFHEFGETARVDCPISAELTPKTLQLYYDMLSAYQRDSGQLEQMRQALSGDGPDYTFSLSAYQRDPASGQSLLSLDAYLDSTDPEDVEALAALVPYLSYEDLVVGESYADVWLTPYYDTAQADADYEAIFLRIPIDQSIFTDETLLDNSEVYVYSYEDDTEAVG